MRISEFGGEQAVISLIAEKYGCRPPGSLLRGIGDDAALIQISADRALIVTTDLLIENTHFRRDLIDPYSLGWKSVAVNISDIAAMAGDPTYTFCSVAFDDVDISYIESLYEGMRDCADAYATHIAGGDTNVSRDRWVISVTQLGEVPPARAVLRSGAQPGDLLLVTGSLGDSKAGLELLFKYGLETAAELNPRAVEAHLRPKPRVGEAIAAAVAGRVHALMDISDGLAADLPKLCAASGVGAIVAAESLPISNALTAAAQQLDCEALQLALQGGEDYELLLAVPESDADIIRAAVSSSTGTQVTIIGSITAGPDVLAEMPDGTRAPLSGGWEHFSRESK